MFADLPARIARTSALFALLVVLPAELLAQSTPPLAPGDRIRISSPKVVAKQTGRFVSMDEETLVLKLDRTGDTLRVALAEWPHLERSGGRMDTDETAFRYAGIGFLAGGAMGMGLGYIIGEESESRGCFMPCTRRELMSAFGPVFGVAGEAVGLLFGVISPPERWERLTLPQGLSIHATPGEGVAVLVTLRR